jgi:DUF4097 and DUF4098 domain-containing protein YvlB/predicted small secreted protein
MTISLRSTAARLGLVLAASWLVTGCDITVGGFGADALRYVEREKKDFQVSGTPDIVLSTFDGSIEIRAWDRAEVSIEVEKRGASKQAVDQIEVKATQTGDRITLEVRQPNEGAAHFGFSASRSARLIASVPRQANVDAHSGDGSIAIERISGKVRLDTGDGSVKGTELAGELRAHTGDGSITLDRVDGRIDADTGDGSINANGKLEGVRLRTGDGSVRVRADIGSRMADDWDIHTGDGSVTLELPEPFDASLDAHTGDGTVSVRGVTVNGGVSKNEVRGQMGTGGRNLRVTSGDGAITISRS